MIETTAILAKKPSQFGVAELGGVCGANSKLTAVGGQGNGQLYTSSKNRVNYLAIYISHTLNTLSHSPKKRRIFPSGETPAFLYQQFYIKELKK